MHFCDKRESYLTMTGTRQSQTETAVKRPLCHHMTLLLVAEVSSCRHIQQFKFNRHLPTSVRKCGNVGFSRRHPESCFFRPGRGKVSHLIPGTSEQLRKFWRSQLTRCYKQPRTGSYGDREVQNKLKEKQINK